MNGNSKQFAVALVSFTVGAILAGVIGNSQTRGRLLDGSKRLVENLRKNE